MNVHVTACVNKYVTYIFLKNSDSEHTLGKKQMLDYIFAQKSNITINSHESFTTNRGTDKKRKKFFFKFNKKLLCDDPMAVVFVFLFEFIYC